MPVAFAVFALAVAATPSPQAEQLAIEFRPADAEAELPERYRLTPARFTATTAPLKSLPGAGVNVFKVTFPSPVKSPVPENNTVHAEYYRPTGDGPFPAVVVLDITGGDQSLSRSIATYLAQSKVAALFVQMAYYGPRRPPGSRMRLLSFDVPRTVEGVRQTVLDCRYAAAYLAARPEVDAARLGIMGTSLGSFVAALTGEMEPRLGRVAVLLGGGGFVDAYYDHPKARPYRAVFEWAGGTKDQVKAVIAPIDPLTHAGRLKARQVLMFAARKDEIVPPVMAERLWEAAGRPTIEWLDAGHYTAIVYLFPMMKRVADHFSAPADKP
jgi:dienelactone hydrolase